MKGTHILWASMLTLAIGAAYVARTTPNMHTGMPTLRIGDHILRLLIARTPDEITKGLSGHAKLPQDMGMLFYFDTPGIYPFWMPNMRFPLDIIWIRDGVVQEIAQLGAPISGQPIPLYTPSVKADHVLEIDAGQAAAYGFIPGAKVVLP